jgi:hypothetical protein
MISSHKVTEIYFIIDEFFKEFDKLIRDHSLQDAKTGKRNRKFTMSQSGVMTVPVLFHSGAFKNLKSVYVFYVQKHMQKDFPNTVSYNRFVELQRKVSVPLAIFVRRMCPGRCTGISFIDSTLLRSCHIKREKQHKTFKGIAEKGQCSTGWFYGFKLHLIINDKGELPDFILTPGNVDDRDPLKNMDLHKRIFGKFFADKGYISKDLFEQLFVDRVHLITKLRKNMKNALMLLHDRIMLRKRALIESVNDELKNMCQIEHTRHRCFDNFIINTLSALAAYSFFDKKPSINTIDDIVEKDMLLLA